MECYKNSVTKPIMCGLWSHENNGNDHKLPLKQIKISIANSEKLIFIMHKIVTPELNLTDILHFKEHDQNKIINLRSIIINCFV